MILVSICVRKNTAVQTESFNVIGQIEGHYVAPSQNKTTKYEHVIPQIVSVEEDPNIDGLLMILNTVLRERKLSPRKLLEHCGVKMVCTTDDPADDLQWHRQLREEKDLSFSVLPAFRPDRALKIAAPDFVSYIYSLGEAAGIHIRSYQEMLRALESRLDTFVELGCRFSDHSLESLADGMPDEEEAAAIFEARMAGEKLDQRHQDRYRLYTLRRLGGTQRLQFFESG